MLDNIIDDNDSNNSRVQYTMIYYTVLFYSVALATRRSVRAPEYRNGNIA